MLFVTKRYYFFICAPTCQNYVICCKYWTIFCTLWFRGVICFLRVTIKQCRIQQSAIYSVINVTNPLFAISSKQKVYLKIVRGGGGFIPAESTWVRFNVSRRRQNNGPVRKRRIEPFYACVLVFSALAHHQPDAQSCSCFLKSSHTDIDCIHFERTP